MATALGFVSYIFTGFGLLTPDAPVIEISTGKVQGICRNSRDGYQYFEYLGIPYGKQIRFEVCLVKELFVYRRSDYTKSFFIMKPPVLVEKWKGILQAKEFGTPCLQLDTLLYGSIIGSEDCLFLNVFTPRVLL